jgi:hypothetical protein
MPKRQCAQYILFFAFRVSHAQVFCPCPSMLNWEEKSLSVGTPKGIWIASLAVQYVNISRFRIFCVFAPFRVFVAHADSARSVMVIWCGVSKREFREPCEISQHDVNAWPRNRNYRKTAYLANAMLWWYIIILVGISLEWGVGMCCVTCMIFKFAKFASRITAKITKVAKSCGVAVRLIRSVWNSLNWNNMIGDYVEYSRVVGYMFKAMRVICNRNKMGGER